MTLSIIQPIISGILFFISFILWYKAEKEGHGNPFLIGLIIALGFPFIISALSFLPDPNSFRLIVQKLVFTGLSIGIGFASYNHYKGVEPKEVTTSIAPKKVKIEEIKIPKDPHIESKALDLNKREKEVKKKERSLERKEDKVKNNFKKASDKLESLKKREKELKDKEKALRKSISTLEDGEMDLEDNKEDLETLKKRKEKELVKIEKRKDKLLKLERELADELRRAKKNV